MSLFRPQRPALVRLAGVFAASLGAAIAVRYLLIENAPLALACDAGAGGGLCAVRSGFVWLFNHGVFGAVALAAAALTLWRPAVVPLAIAALSSAFGMLLYNGTPAALAVGIALLAFARAPATRASAG